MSGTRGTGSVAPRALNTPGSLRQLSPACQIASVKERAEAFRRGVASRLPRVLATRFKKSDQVRELIQRQSKLQPFRHQREAARDAPGNRIFGNRLQLAFGIEQQDRFGSFPFHQTGEAIAVPRFNDDLLVTL